MKALGKRNLFRVATALASAILTSSACLGAEIRGIVRDEARNHLPGAVVTARSVLREGEVFRGTTSKDGAFVVAVPFGSYSLEASLGGFVTGRHTPVDVSRPVAHWNFTLQIGAGTEGGIEPGAHLTGILRSRDRRYPGAVVCLTDTRERHCATANSLGEYDLVVDPGKYSAEVRLEGRTLWTQQIDASRPGDYKDVISP